MALWFSSKHDEGFRSITIMVRVLYKRSGGLGSLTTSAHSGRLPSGRHEVTLTLTLTLNLVLKEAPVKKLHLHSVRGRLSPPKTGIQISFSRKPFSLISFSTTQLACLPLELRPENQKMSIENQLKPKKTWFQVVSSLDFLVFRSEFQR